MGVNGTYEAMSAAPDKFYMKMSITDFGDTTAGSDGKTVWSVDPFADSHENPVLD